MMNMSKLSAMRVAAYQSIILLSSGGCQAFSIGAIAASSVASPPAAFNDVGPASNRRRVSGTSLLSQRRDQSSPEPQETTAAADEFDEEVMTTTSSRMIRHGNTTTIVSLTLRESYVTLMAMAPGEYVVSDPFTVDETYDFRVKVYPKGGGQRPTSGFGMAYQISSAAWWTTNTNPRLSVYLQFLPRVPTQTVDASFALRLKGRQKLPQQPRFDVEWRAGMRFQADTDLSRGVANDFGAHLMQTVLLRDFLGVDDEGNDEDDAWSSSRNHQAQLVVEVEVKIHDGIVAPPNSSSASRGRGPFWEDVRQRGNVRVASVVVPVLKKLSERPAMMAQGVYPGVEYRILRIRQGNDDIFHHQPNATYELKPIYPLVPALERPWPVSVRESDIPTLVSPNAYNAGSAVLSLVTAVTGLAVAFWLSTAISLFYIPSRSMEPTLQIGDVLLVEKVSMGELRQRDIVLFRPPTALQDIVAANGGRLNPRDLFVKRVAGLPGDSYRVAPRIGTVHVNGDTVLNQLCQADNGVAKFLPDNDNDDNNDASSSSSTISSGGTKVVPDDSVLALGDCGNVSVDSRVWGPLPRANLVGRPLLRIWPMDRMGPVR